MITIFLIIVIFFLPMTSVRQYTDTERRNKLLTLLKVSQDVFIPMTLTLKLASILRSPLTATHL